MPKRIQCKHGPNAVVFSGGVAGGVDTGTKETEPTLSLRLAISALPQTSRPSTEWPHRFWAQWGGIAVRAKRCRNSPPWLRGCDVYFLEGTTVFHRMMTTEALYY